jgi:hypothetical protein
MRAAAFLIASMSSVALAACNQNSVPNISVGSSTFGTDFNTNIEGDTALNADDAASASAVEFLFNQTNYTGSNKVSSADVSRLCTAFDFPGLQWAFKHEYVKYFQILAYYRGVVAI